MKENSVTWLYQQKRPDTFTKNKGKGDPDVACLVE